MRYLILVLLMGLRPLYLVGQVALDTESQVSAYQKLPRETTYLHSNTSFLLTGEYLFYKVYVFDSGQGGLTTFSKVAYVELLEKDGQLIFRHKIVLNEGQGHGDFFVPTDIASGVYKLVAYTNWMRNQDQNDFYQGDVTIVNPYRSNQPELLKNSLIRSDSMVAVGNDTLVEPIPLKMSIEDIGPITLDVSEKKFPRRARVVLSFGKEANREISGNYSVSVRKKDLVYEPSIEHNAAFYLNKIGNKGDLTAALGDSIVLPEFRGELFYGKVKALEDGTSVKNLKVAVSVPGGDYVLEVVQTDAFGNFHVNISKSYSGEKMVLKVLSENPEAYRVQIREPKNLDHSKLDFKEINIGLSMREEILQRSIHNQIENSYFQFRPDSILTIAQKQFFDDKPKKTYLLDDYTRFKTLRETLVEIVQDAYSKRIGTDDYAIRVKGYDYTSVTDISPLILLDGCLVQDHNALLTFDTRLIEAIDVFRQQFVFGPEIYEGALILTSKEGNAYELFQNDNRSSTFNLLQPQPDKKYFMQRYGNVQEDEGNTRLPDDRLQLLWIPELKLKQDEYQIEFFTSDVSGTFEIRLEGITDDNKPVSVRKSIVVE